MEGMMQDKDVFKMGGEIPIPIPKAESLKNITEHSNEAFSNYFREDHKKALDLDEKRRKKEEKLK